MVLAPARPSQKGSIHIILQCWRSYLGQVIIWLVSIQLALQTASSSFVPQSHQSPSPYRSGAARQPFGPGKPGAKSYSRAMRRPTRCCERIQIPPSGEGGFTSKISTLSGETGIFNRAWRTASSAVGKLAVRTATNRPAPLFIRSWVIRTLSHFSPSSKRTLYLRLNFRCIHILLHLFSTLAEFSQYMHQHPVNQHLRACQSK